MIIVHSGPRYVDIDGFACLVAFAELLRRQGKPAVGSFTGALNGSATPTIRRWNIDYVHNYQPARSDTFAAVDVSDPVWFDTFADTERVEYVIDHHPGFEQYWRERIGDRAIIEPVGAAATLVYEQWQKAGMLDKLSPVNAGLLASAILDNTLDFRAKITDQRDKVAYRELLTLSRLPQDWDKQYFQECQTAIEANLSQSVYDDTKELDFGFGQPVAVGQVAVWNGAHLAKHRFDDFRATLITDSPLWFANIISISDNQSYFITDVDSVKAWITKTLDAKFDGNTAPAGRLWLRKEIIKRYQDIK